MNIIIGHDKLVQSYIVFLSCVCVCVCFKVCVAMAIVFFLVRGYTYMRLNNSLFIMFMSGLLHACTNYELNFFGIEREKKKTSETECL
jgi:hypothetical protein